MKNIIIVGASGHSRVVVDIIEKQSKYRISGFVDSGRTVGECISGYNVLGAETEIPELVETHKIAGFIIAIGDNSVRSIVADKIKRIFPQAEFVSAIHPQAVIGKDVCIGTGTVVMAGAIINPCSTVGNFCIINTKASLDHDSLMGDFSSLAPGVTTGGNCNIGNFSAIGIGASIKHGVTIGAHSVVGGAAMVMQDIEAFTVNYGIPSKKIRNRTQGEKYL